MDLYAIALGGFGLWVATMWRLHAIQEEVRVLRARVEKGAPLTEDEEARATQGDQGLSEKA